MVAIVERVFNNVLVDQFLVHQFLVLCLITGHEALMPGDLGATARIAVRSKTKLHETELLVGWRIVDVVGLIRMPQRLAVSCAQLVD